MSNLRIFDTRIPGVRSATVALCLLLPVGYGAFANAFHTPAPYKYGEWHPTNFAWTKEPWTGDDAPFLKVRREVEAAKNSGLPDIQHLYLRYEQRALAHPGDAVLQYGWAYSMYLSGRTFSRAEVSAPASALATVASPHCFEFDRVRFLFESAHFKAFESDAAIADMANRLIAREPKSEGIRQFAVLYLSRSKSAANQDTAIQIALSLVQLHPSNYYEQSLLGSAYNFRWMKRRNPGDLRSAITAYEASLDRNPDPKWKHFLTKILLPQLKDELAKAEAKKKASG